MAVLEKYTWLIAIVGIAFIISSLSNGANDVANSYATSVAARTLTLGQAGILSIFTEFIGAVALGANVTDTIKNGIFSLDNFRSNPSVLILAMTAAEVGSATWLFVATLLGMPVSTTQTIVGALAGVGIASGVPLKWRWTKGSLSQIAASWLIAPVLAGAFGALVFTSVKVTVLWRKNSLKWAIYMVPFYFAMTATILAIFLIVETIGDLEDFSAGEVTGIILGVFFGILAIAYVFFLPYFKRIVVDGDSRLKVWHLPLGPLLWRENPPLYWPGKAGEDVVIDYYDRGLEKVKVSESDSDSVEKEKEKTQTISNEKDGSKDIEVEGAAQADAKSRGYKIRPKKPSPEQRFIHPYKHLPLYAPARLAGYAKWTFLQGITRDVVGYNASHIAEMHDRAVRYDVKVEHMFTYAQVASAIIMSISHGANDVANAVGPWSAAYATWQSGEVSTRNPTPIWMLVVAGLCLGIGFCVFGFRVMRALGNKITQHSPTRGYSMELGAAITVLIASRYGIPVSTTQCLTGATIGVGLCSADLKAVNWRQVAFIFSSWLLTLPCAGLIGGLIMGMALNTPHF